ncbi:MAG: ABC transporter substrate-binding protein [Planctomycetota bacterium]|jgi:ABC-type transport system substrate-binding protein
MRNLLTLSVTLIVISTLPAPTVGLAQAVEDKPAEMVHYRAEVGAPRSVDPHSAGDVVSSRHAGMMYETLYEYGPFGSTELKPCLAASMPEVSEDGLTYTFKMRKDVHFAPDQCFDPKADGKVYLKGNDFKNTKGPLMTAHDFVYSIKRLAALPNSGFWVLEGMIVGLDLFRELSEFNETTCFTASFSNHLKSTKVKGITATDSHTVKILLTKPYPQVLHALTLSYGSVMSPTAIEYYGWQINNLGVGTGAFIRDETGPSKFTYERNPEYREERLADVPLFHDLKPFEGKRLPLCDRVEFKVIEDDDVRWNLFLKGKLDISGITSDNFENVIEFTKDDDNSGAIPKLKKGLSDKGIVLTTYEEPTIHYVSFNMTDPVVGTAAGEKGKAIRKALALSFDRERYVKEQLNQRGTPAVGVLPPGCAGYDESSQASQKYDIDAAKKVLTDAGYKLEGDKEIKCLDPDTNKQVTINVLYRSTSDSMAKTAKLQVEFAAKVGILIEPEMMTFGEFLRRQDEGDGQAYDAGWVMDYPDAQNMLQLLYGPNKPPGINSASFDNKEYNKLYSEMAALDESKPEQLKTKLELIRKMADVLEEETPWICVEYRKTFRLTQKGVALPSPNAFSYTGLKYVGVKR